MHAENKFYGEHSSGLGIAGRKALRPGPGETKKQFIERGGIMGELANDDIQWNSDANKFEKSSSVTQFNK